MFSTSQSFSCEDLFLVIIHDAAAIWEEKKIIINKMGTEKVDKERNKHWGLCYWCLSCYQLRANVTEHSKYKI